MEESWIFDGIRTPFGRYGGVLAPLRPDDMMAVIIRELVQRHSGIEEVLEDVVIGDSNQAGEDSRNVGRNALLLAGLPVKVSGITVNRLCGSGLAAAAQVSNSIKSKEGGWKA